MLEPGTACMLSSLQRAAGGAVFGAVVDHRMDWVALWRALLR
jgi:hypothetical protein